MSSPLNASPAAITRLGRERGRLIRAAVVALVSIGIGSALALGGDYYYSDRAETKQKLESERSTLSTQISQMESDAREASTAVKLYGLLMRASSLPESGEVDFSLSREQLAAHLTEMRTKHMLQDLLLSAQAPQVGAQGLAQLKGGKEVSLQVELTIKAWSDVDIADFVRDLTTGLPGYVDMQEFSMQRESAITPEVLATAAQRGRIPLVSAKLRFLWRGVQPNPKPAAPAAAPVGIPGAPQAMLMRRFA